MFLIRFIRWLLGWVRLEAEGGFPERLLNLAAREHIQLWNTARHGIHLDACCFARRYRKLRPIARKAGMRMHVRERHGVPFFLRRYRARSGIIAGLAVYIALLQLLSQRVWVLDVSGNETVSDQSILDVLEPMGVHLGGRFDELDINTIQLAAVQKLPGLSWLAVNLEGSIAHVEVMERRPTPELIDPNRPSNIKAARDGRILSMEVSGGEAAVQKGDAVVGGTLLVSGVVQSTAGPILKRAQAKILAETTRKLEVCVPLEESLLLPGREVVLRPTFYLFGIEVPLYTDGKLDGEHRLEVYEHPLLANGIRLPIGVTNRRYTMLEHTDVKRTQEEAAVLAASRLDTKEKSDLAGVEIRNAARSGRMEKGVYILSGTYSCVEDIGIEEQILLENMPSGDER